MVNITDMNQLGMMNPSIFSFGAKAFALFTSAGVASAAAVVYHFGPRVGHQKEGSGLKVKSPDVKDFSGENEDWSTWKMSTETTLIATGYNKIINSDEPIGWSLKEKNHIVYALLASATVNGSANWIVRKCRTTMDGRAAWKKLTSWYDGLSIQVDVATGLRNILHTTVMVPGTELNKFTNKFVSAYDELELIPGQAMSEDEAKDILLGNIQDADYKNCVEFLSTNLSERSLMEVVQELRKKAMSLERKKETHKRIRRMNEKLNNSSEAKSRAKKQKTDGTGSLPSTVVLNGSGIINVTPADVWKNLKREHRDFVIKYNRAKKHGDELPNPPKDVTIVESDTSKENLTPRKLTELSIDPTDSTDRQVSFHLTRRVVSKLEDDNDVNSVELEFCNPFFAPDGTLIKQEEDWDGGSIIKNNNTEFSPYSMPRRFISSPKRQIQGKSNTDRFVLDTGGGRRPTITERAWTIVGGTTGMTARLTPYQTTQVFEHPIVSGVTKAHIANLDEPILLKVNYATYISEDHDANERESLLTTMDMGNLPNIEINGVHPSDDKCGITVDGQFLEFDWDDESVFFTINKPTEEEMELYHIYELNSPLPPAKRRRLPKQQLHDKFKSIPMVELQKRFSYLPPERIRKTLENTTQYYLDIAAENQSNPKKHFKKRFKAIPDRRQNEMVATDYVYSAKRSCQGHKGAQFFTTTTSKRWAFYPLHKESQNSQALQDYICEYGPPITLISDNAKSETGAVWTQILRNFMIQTRTSEPHHPHQNPAESEWGRMSNMMKNVLRQSTAPPELWHWVGIHCAQVNNHTSRRSLKNKTPMEVSTGNTPDISKFRFYFYEPIWYYVPSNKNPKPDMLKARYLAIAESCGDSFTYFILTEPDDPKASRQLLMRSVIKSRRKQIGTPTEYVNDNPHMDSFTLTLSQATSASAHIEDELVHEDTPLLISGEKLGDDADETESEKLAEVNLEKGDLEDDEEQLPLEMNSTNDAESHQAIIETVNPNLEGECEFRSILQHAWIDGVLTLKAQYTDPTHGMIEIDTPFKKLKMDEPLACAKYIKEYIPESRRGDRPLNDWATNTIEQHTNVIRRMIEVDPQWEPEFEDTHARLIRTLLLNKLRRMIMEKVIRRNGPSRNQKWIAKRHKEKFGIRIPNTIEEAILFDQQAGNTLWQDAIKKEMTNLDRLKVFKYHPPTKQFAKEDGWQVAPLRMIFDIKNEDKRRKARFVVGGHRVDSTGYNTYSSQVDNLSVLLLFLIAQHQGLTTMTCDISNAFPTAPNSEKVYAIAGEAFGDRKGCIVEIQRALYGLAGSARAFADFLADSLLRIGFIPSRADPDLWIKQTSYGYDYIATHVDDLIVVSKNPQEYISIIEQEFALRNIELDPKYYLGAKFSRLPDGKLAMNMEDYIKEVIRKYETTQELCLKKQNVPMPVDCKPEMDKSELLSTKRHKEFQHIIGICQWLILRGRIDITYATCSLSRFAAAPREKHLELARHILGYLKKFPKKGIVIDPTPPKFQSDTEKGEYTFEQFGHQYNTFTEEIDPHFPEPRIPQLDTTIFSDADHGHDLVTGKSVTGTLAFVGSTPTYWKSTRQTSVQTSTYGSEFTALKKAVETAVTIRYHLRAMGVVVTRPTKIFVDNKSVFINAANPASSLNKKTLALSYHFVRQYQSAKVVDIQFIKSENNYSDMLTKSLNSSKLRSLIHEFMIN